jgi:hypothetical protein
VARDDWRIHRLAVGLAAGRHLSCTGLDGGSDASGRQAHRRLDECATRNTIGWLRLHRTLLHHILRLLPEMRRLI